MNKFISSTIKNIFVNIYVQVIDKCNPYIQIAFSEEN